MLCLLKIWYYEKATKMWKDIPIYLALPFFQNFAAFSEYLNFIKQIYLKKDLFPTYSSSTSWRLQCCGRYANLTIRIRYCIDFMVIFARPPKPRRRSKILGEYVRYTTFFQITCYKSKENYPWNCEFKCDFKIFLVPLRFLKIC